MLDSIRTQNANAGENRILSGKYSDPLYGEVYAEGITQFYPSNFTISVPATAVLDSSFFTLRTDYFQYGGSDVSEQKFTIHELTQTLKGETQGYYSKTPTSYDPAIVGQASITVDPAVYKKEFDDTDADPVVALKFPLEAGYANRLFRAINKDDEAFTKFVQFREIFKGLAIVPDASNNKVVGFNLGSTQSFITLYYHDGDQKFSFSYLMNGIVNYSRLNYDRSNTDFASVTGFNTGYEANGKRGVQSGSGIVTKLDFKNFYNYTDTIPNIVVNSAELVISNVDPVGSYYPPVLVMSLLRGNNKLFAIRRGNVADSTQDVNVLNSYRGLVKTEGQIYAVASDNINTAFSMQHSAASNSFSGFTTLFFQELYYLKKREAPVQNFCLYPIFPPINQSVYRTSFNANQIKLRLYYTRPLTAQ